MKSCMNCGEADAEGYDLPVRSDATTKTYLCENCVVALREALAAD